LIQLLEVYFNYQKGININGGIPCYKEVVWLAKGVFCLLMAVYKIIDKDKQIALLLYCRFEAVFGSDFSLFHQRRLLFAITLRSYGSPLLVFYFV